MATTKTTTKATTSKRKTIKTPILEEFFDEVNHRAFEIFQEREENNVPGDSMSDWIQAEKELKKKYKIK